MNETVAEQASFFASPLTWSGEPSAVEEFAYSDGLVALTLGRAAVLACGLAALVITIAYEAGRIS